MILYAESSAVMAWLLDEPRSVDVINAIESASLVVTSDLTAIECGRAIHRALKGDRIDKAQADSLQHVFTAAGTQWDWLEIGERVVALASGSFPVEPVRSLDAIHLASIMIAREVWSDIAVLSLDERVRANAAALRCPLLLEPA